MTPWPRRSLQALALALVAAAPVISMWGVGSARRWSDAELAWRYGPLAPEATALAHRVLGDPPDGMHDVVTGGTWSMAIGGVELADPIALVSLAAAGGLSGAAGSLLLGAGLVALFQALTGRFFCGYLCPYGTLARLMGKLRRPLAPWVLNIQPHRRIRYALLALVVLAPVAGLSMVSLTLPYLGVSRLLHAAVFGGGAAVLGVVGAFLLSDLLLWDHGVCRSLCPAGAWQRELGRLRVFRLIAHRQKACNRGCHQCEDICWLGLDPRSGAPDPDCDACGRCISVCPNNRLGFGLGPGKLRKSKQARKATAQAAALLFVFIAGCGDARAPEPVALTPGINTPFAPPAEGPEVRANTGGNESSAGHATTFQEWDGARGAISVGATHTDDGLVWLRFFLEEAPGEVYRGPLTVEVENSAGSTTLVFDRPREPRSTPRPSLYEAAVDASGPLTVRFTDGPAEGESAVVGRHDRRARGALRAAVVPPSLVVLVWLVGLLTRRAKPAHQA